MLPPSPHSTLLGRAATSHREAPSSIIGYFTKRDSITSFLGEEVR